MHAHVSQGTGTIMIIILVVGNSKVGEPTKHLLVVTADAHSHTYNLG